MEKITSFTIDHLRLLPGVYVSRKDMVGDRVVTTFDIRMTRPNFEPVINTAELHAIEHLGATFLRNHKEWDGNILYFGPMGCRTGFYLLLNGDYESRTSFHFLRRCLLLSKTLKVKYREPVQRTAAITLISTCLWQSMWLQSILTRYLQISQMTDWYIPNRIIKEINNVKRYVNRRFAYLFILVYESIC